MAWDLATAKKYLGIDQSDPTNDDAIQLTMSGVMDLVEAYLARRLDFAGPETETLFRVQPGRLYVTRYPIKEIVTIDGEAFDPEDALVDYGAGWIAWETYDFVVEIEYSGGYEVLPPSLEAALWEIFMMEWAKRDPVTGGPVPGSSIIQGSGEISRVTVQDLGTVSFDVGATSVASQNNAAQEATWGILAPWATILQVYRRGDAGAGLGFA